MLAWFNDLLVGTDSFMPHGACYLWLPSILWLHISSDSIIALAYYSILFALLYFVQKRTDLGYRWVFVLFGVFIGLCGTTHLIGIWTIWHPDYWLDGLVKFATALVSIVPALLVWPLIPKLLQLPSPVALLESEARYHALVQSANDAIVIVNSSGTVVSWNRGAELTFGYTEAEIKGQPVYRLMPEQYRFLHLAGIDRVMSGGEARVIGKTVELEGLHKDQGRFPLELSLTQWQTSEGWFCSAFVRDITERKMAEEKIKQLAFYDPLTQLPNRRLLLERLKHGIDVERREGKQLALLMLDLDRFKAVNDSLGHQAGDELLQQVAIRITSRLRDVDMVARLGGDEFIVLLEDIAHTEDAARIAKDIVTELTKSFRLSQSDHVQIGASIGISLYPQHGDTPEILMARADAALYQAKDAGRGCFAYFSEDLTIAARERIELEARLRKAIEQQELRVFYQPQVDIVSGLIIGAEALVRWQHPTEGLIAPIHFIPVAEETGLIIAIGEWVLRETCNQGRQWLDEGLPPLTLAVNVSPHQFRRGDINNLITAVLNETGFPSQQLELEITESGLMENQDKATDILTNLRRLGIRLAIDDFGTGYSSLAYLKRFPLDVLKIDRSFIVDIPHHQDDMEIAATIIAMGHTLGLMVLAEGVETPEQLAFLQNKGCDRYQGFIKSRPVPAEAFAELLRGQQEEGRSAEVCADLMLI